MCGTKCGSIFWSFLYMMSGVALLGVGIWTPVDTPVFDSVNIRSPQLSVSKTPWRGIIGGLLALGCYCFLVGILGMAGAACDLEEKVANSLIAFAVFASFGIIATMILAAIVTAGFVKNDEEKYYKDAIEGLRWNYTDQVKEIEFIKAWNRFQIDKKCCGLYNFTDYLNSGHYNETDATLADVPWSCCILKEDYDEYYPVRANVEDAGRCVTEGDLTPPFGGALSSRHDKGCGKIVWDVYSTWQTVMLAISWTAVGIQLIALIVTGCMKKDALRGG